MFPKAEALLRDDDGMYCESFPHCFVPEVTIPPPQGVSLGDVSEEWRPVLERRVKDPHRDECAYSVCAADRERRSAKGVEGEHGSQPEISERESAVEDLRSHVRFRWTPIAWSEIAGVEMSAVADIQPECTDGDGDGHSPHQELPLCGVWWVSPVGFRSHSGRKQGVRPPL